MTAPISGPTGGSAAGATAARADAEDAKLRNAARQLEGVFTQQLFKAMRATVPEGQGEIGDSGGAQDMFTGLLDERLANDPRASSTHGIGDAIYHHLLRVRGGQHSATQPDSAQPTAAPNAAPPSPAGVTMPAGGASLRATR